MQFYFYIFRLNLDQRTSVARSENLGRLMKAVVSMGVTTTLAFPFTFALMRVLLFFGEDQGFQEYCGGPGCEYLGWAVGGFLQTFNSSVNVVYYFLFLKQFRASLVKRCKCFRRCKLNMNSAAENHVVVYTVSRN